METRTDSAAQGTAVEAPPTVGRTIRIEMMGVIADLAGTRELSLEFAGTPTLRELFTELEARYGADYAARIYRTSTAPRMLQMCARIFVNGTLIDDRNLDEAIPAVSDDRAQSEVLVFILPAACGG